MIEREIKRHPRKRKPSAKREIKSQPEALRTNWLKQGLEDARADINTWPEWLKPLLKHFIPDEQRT